MKKSMRFSQSAICVIVIIICGCALWNGNNRILERWGLESVQNLRTHIQRMYMPILMYVQEDSSKGVAQKLVEQAMMMVPIASYIKEKGVYVSETEDSTTYEMILTMQANEENEVDVNGNLVNPETVLPITDTSPVSASALDTSIERLRDFDYLLNNFYIVDSTTMIGPEQLNPDDLLNRNMKITKQDSAPKVLIFHTHSQETFADSIPGDVNSSIVGVGAYLAKILNEQYKIPTMHHQGVYDLIDGKLDRSSAYEFAEAEITQILAANPSIEVVIDLHRDGVNPETHLVTDVAGKPTAQIMFFNGLSRTRANGDIPYLANPYIQDNLAFSLQLQIASEKMFTDFTRRIYLRGYRYSLHMMPKSLLVEAGAQTNSVEEMRNAMEALGRLLYEVTAKE